MSSHWNTLDRQAPIPYVRDKAKKAFEAPTVKFQFEREQTRTVRKETLNDRGVPTGHTVETSTYAKDCKVTLKTFAHSSDEDGEHWLLVEALMMVKKELLANQIPPFSPSPTLNLIHKRDLRHTATSMSS